MSGTVPFLPIGASAGAAALLNVLESPNVRAQFAWDLRDGLMKTLTAKPEAALTDGQRFLLGELRAVAAGEIDPDVANKVFYALARGLAPEQLYLRVDDVVERVTLRTAVQLRLALHELRHPRTSRAHPTMAKAMKLPAAELGREIVGRLWDGMIAPDGALPALLERTSTLPPFLLGQLATAVGAKDAPSFLAALEKASPEEVAQAAAWVDDAVGSWRAIGEAVDFQGVPSSAAPKAAERVRQGPAGASAAVSAAEVRERLTSLGIAPETSPVLRAELDRLTTGLSATFEVPEDALRFQLRARQREATQAFVGVIDRLEHAFGPERTAKVLARIDVDAELAGLASLKEGIRFYTDLDSPGPMRAKTNRLAARLGGEALRLLGDELRGAIDADPALADVRRALERHGRDAPYVRVALASLLADWAHPADALETGWRRAARVAGAVQGPEGFRPTLAKMAQELATDRAGFVQDLTARLDELKELQGGVLDDGWHRALLTRHLEGGVLPVQKSTVEAIKAHLAACYPSEGIGYLVGDGRATYFFPVRNLLAGTAAGHDRGEAKPEDEERFARALEKLGLECLGKVHSHPDQSPVFSDGDLGGMRAPVAIAPELRTIILEVSAGATPAGPGLPGRLASFASRVDGQVRAEDRVEVT